MPVALLPVPLSFSFADDTTRPGRDPPHCRPGENMQIKQVGTGRCRTILAGVWWFGTRHFPYPPDFPLPPPGGHGRSGETSSLEPLENMNKCDQFPGSALSSWLLRHARVKMAGGEGTDALK